MRHSIVTVLSILLSLLGNSAQAKNPHFPPHTPIAGGVAIIPLKELPNKIKQPQVSFQKKRVMVVKRRGVWHAIVGIPLETASGEAKILVENTKPKQAYTFYIKPKIYREEHIILKDHNLIEPNKPTQKRIEREFQKTVKLFQTWTNSHPTYLKFPLPTSGRKTSSFGVKRIFNGIPKSPHAGMDIAARAGTKVVAPIQGRVIGIGNFFYAGKVIFIDHGMGLITNYAHLKKIVVKPGQKVATGQKIGEVGATGRTTGAHLHWGVSLNNARVDPDLFIKKES